MKELALEAAEAAFRDGIKTAATNLVNNWIGEPTADQRRAAVERHRVALQLWKDAHEATVAVINELFP